MQNYLVSGKDDASSKRLVLSTRKKIKQIDPRITKIDFNSKKIN